VNFMLRYIMITVMLAIGVTGILGGCSWGGQPANPAAHTGAAPVASLADAGQLGYSAGANLLRWQSVGNHVLANIVYRISNGQNMPIAVLPAGITWYVDAGALPVANKVNVWTTAYKLVITTTSPQPFLTTNTATPGASQSVDVTAPLPASLATSVTPTANGTEIDVTVLNLPLIPGQIVTYRLQSIYWNYVPTTINSSGEQIPSTTGLFLGEQGIASTNVVLLTPPILTWPTVGAGMDGTFQCATVPGGSNYVLQISSDATFSPAKTLPLIPAASSIANPSIMEADVSLAGLAASAQLQGATTVYVRMGVRNAVSVAPAALTYTYDNGYVFSDYRSFNL